MSLACGLRRNREAIAAVIVLAFITTAWFILVTLNTQPSILPSYQKQCPSQSSRQESTSIASVNDYTTVAINETFDNEQNFITLESHEDTIKWIGNHYVAKYDRKLSVKSCKHPPLLVLAINSAANHFNRRSGIRKTWGNPTEFNIRFESKNLWKVIFIVGRTGSKVIDERVDKEAKNHGDLLMINLKEHHKSLTDKTLLGMYWASQICRSQFYYKGDDDVWVNKWRLFDLIIKLNVRIESNIDLSSCWIGFVSSINHVPIRNKKSKYYVSYEDFNGERFPRFCSGFGYFMSRETASKVITSVPYVKKIPGIDDVYIGILANNTGIQPIHNPRFHIRTYDVNKLIYNGKMLYETIAEHGVHNSQLMIKFQQMARRRHIAFMKDDKR